MIIAGLALPNQIIKQHGSDSRPQVTLADSQDSELMADLDDLMGSDDSGVLEDVATL